MTNGDDRFDSAFDEKDEGASPSIKRKKPKPKSDARTEWAQLVFQLIDEAAAETNPETQRRRLTDIVQMVETAEKRKMLPFRVLEMLVEKFPPLQVQALHESHKGLVQLLKQKQRGHVAYRVEQLLPAAINEVNGATKRDLFEKLFDMVERAKEGRYLSTRTLKSFVEAVPDSQVKAFGSRYKDLLSELLRRETWEAKQLLNQRAADKVPTVVYGLPEKVADDAVAETPTPLVPSEDNVVSLVQPGDKTGSDRVSQEDLEKLTGSAPKTEAKEKKGGLFSRFK